MTAYIWSKNIQYTFNRKKGLMWDVPMFDRLSDGASKTKGSRNLGILYGPEFYLFSDPQRHPVTMTVSPYLSLGRVWFRLLIFPLGSLLFSQDFKNSNIIEHLGRAVCFQSDFALPLISGHAHCLTEVCDSPELVRQMGQSLWHLGTEAQEQYLCVFSQNSYWHTRVFLWKMLFPMVLCFPPVPTDDILKPAL